MPKKAKSKKSKKPKKKTIDEYQLRRDLWQHKKMSEAEEKLPVPAEESKKPADVRIGGIEGGGTHSTLIIIDGNGNKLTEIKGPDTNHWILGMEETGTRINSMIERAKQRLQIPENIPLDCVGLCLSGCDEEETNHTIKKNLLEKYPHASKDYLIECDTYGSIRTALEKGGVVLIAGTGSNAMLVNPDGTTHNCGGWSYMMGDEGSGYWIAHRACKYVFDDMDDLARAPYSTSYVWPAMRNFFQVKDRKGILSHLYTNFDKSMFASFAKEIALGCKHGDLLCLAILEEAGQLLARHIIAVGRKAHNDLKLTIGGLKIVCVGSVFKSWSFLQKGFVKELTQQESLDELSLLRLTVSSAFGACYLAAEKRNYFFEKPYHENVEVFFHYKRDHYLKQNDEKFSESSAVLPNGPNFIECPQKADI